jgi:hypothetical protein
MGEGEVKSQVLTVMGIFEEVTGAVGKLALSPKGWRLAALISITILCAAAYGVQKLVIVVVEADRQAFIDRDANNATAAKAAADKAEFVDLKTTKSINLMSDRTDTLEKEFIELRTEYKTDARWIKQTLQRWDTPPPTPPK